MKKILLNEAEKKAIILEREQAIVKAFAKTFNTIKRINENELNENDGEDYEAASRSIQYGINPYQDQPDLGEEKLYKVEVIGQELEKDGGHKHRWIYDITAKDELEAEEKATAKFNIGFRLSDISLFSVKTLTNPTDKDVVQDRGTKLY